MKGPAMAACASAARAGSGHPIFGHAANGGDGRRDAIGGTGLRGLAGLERLQISRQGLAALLDETGGIGGRDARFSARDRAPPTGKNAHRQRIQGHAFQGNRAQGKPAKRGNRRLRVGRNGLWRQRGLAASALRRAGQKTSCKNSPLRGAPRKEPKPSLTP